MISKITFGTNPVRPPEAKRVGENPDAMIKKVRQNKDKHRKSHFVPASGQVTM